MCMYCTPGPTEELKVQMPSGGKSNEALCLTLPGNELDLSALLKDKKFRGRGNKEGALQAMRILEEDELGKLEEKQTKGSVKVHSYRQHCMANILGRMLIPACVLKLCLHTLLSRFTKHTCTLNLIRMRTEELKGATPNHQLNARNQSCFQVYLGH